MRASRCPLGYTSCAVDLDGLVDDVADFLRHHGLDSAHIDTRFFIAEGVHRLGGLQYHQAAGVDLNACARHQFNVLTQSDDWLPNAWRVVERRIIISKARSATPIERMQWWIRPGPKRT